MTQRSALRVAFLAPAAALAAIGLWFMHQSLENAIPVPFRMSSALQGLVTDIGIKNNKRLLTVTFDLDEISEPLSPDALHFVLTPDSPTISHGAPLSKALPAGKRIFGYKYTSRAATVERDAKARADAGQPVPFPEMFPGTFFATAEMRADGDFISRFETQTGIRFRTLDEVTVDRSARYVVAVNDSGLRIAVRSLSWCGDGQVHPPGECDAGMVAVNIAVTDDSSIARVELFVDDVLRMTDTQVPYGFVWDTNTLPNGPHTLRATAVDAVGNAGQSSIVNVILESQ